MNINHGSKTDSEQIDKVRKLKLLEAYKMVVAKNGKALEKLAKN